MFLPLCVRPSDSRTNRKIVGAFWWNFSWGWDAWQLIRFNANPDHDTVLWILFLKQLLPLRERAYCKIFTLSALRWFRIAVSEFFQLVLFSVRGNFKICLNPFTSKALSALYWSVFTVQLSTGTLRHAVIPLESLFRCYNIMTVPQFLQGRVDALSCSDLLGSFRVLHHPRNG